MKKKAIITDEIDLSEKKLFTEKDFYQVTKSSAKDSKSIQTADSSNKMNDNSENDYYALVSVSDKLINNRKYSYDSWKQTVEDGSWLKPYKKPILKNHDLYYGEPRGRIQNVFMYDHATKQVVAKSLDEELPQDVIDHFTESGAFQEGTGSVICRFTADEELSKRLDSGLDTTVSQSSFMGKATCSICGKDYYGPECEHYAGQEYVVDEKTGTKEMCYVEASDFDPIELSFVNLPANNDSTTCCRPKKKKKGKKCDSDDTDGDVSKDSQIENNNTASTEASVADSQQENPVIDNKAEDKNENGSEPVTDSKDVKEEPAVIKTEDAKVTSNDEEKNKTEDKQSNIEEPKVIDANQVLKTIVTQYFKEKLLVDEKAESDISKLIDSATEEQLQNLFNIVSSIKTIAIEQIADTIKTVENSKETEQTSQDENEKQPQPEVNEPKQPVEDSTNNEPEVKESETKVEPEPNKDENVIDNVSSDNNNTENPVKTFYSVDNKGQNETSSYCPEIQAIINNLN